MSKTIISTENAPAAVGPYSQAVQIGNLIYTSGQIALDPETMELVTADEKATAVQTEQVFKNLQAVLEGAGSSLDNVIKTTVFLRFIGDYAEMNEVYARFFGDNPPARSAFAVGALPLKARVEIEAVAYVDEPEPATAVAVEVELEKPKKKKKDKKDKKGKKKSKKVKKEKKNKK